MSKTARVRRRNLTVLFPVTLNIFVAVALAVSYLAPYVNPQQSWIPAMSGLFYPLLFVLNALFVAWWLIRWRWYFMISLLTLLLGWNVIFSHVSPGKSKPVGSYDDALKVLSYNVRLFNQHVTGGKNLFTRNAIFNLVKSENAGVVCFQEFFHGNEKYFPTIEPFIAMQDAKNYYADYVKISGDRKHYGLATFSKYPIIGKGKIRFEGALSNSGIYTDILFQGDTVRVFNFHLESVHFSKSDREYMRDMVDPTLTNASGSVVIFKKLRRAFISRAQQAETVARYIAASPYAVIVCGDFNDTPASYTYHTIKNHRLKDAFLESGSGIGATYAGGIPFLRIDYILHSPELEAYRFKEHHVDYSDHYPVSCYLRIK